LHHIGRMKEYRILESSTKLSPAHVHSGFIS
jgi:hypothetical protein